MKRIPTIGLLFAATLLAGCGGGGTSTPTAKATSIVPSKASASVRFRWPVRAASSATRNALYISPFTDHITITNTSYGASYLAPSDLVVRVPFGTQTASLPAYVGYNAWSFVEYRTADDSGVPIASAVAAASVSTTNSPTIDVALNLNVNNMGASIASDSSSVFSTTNLVKFPTTTNGAVHVSSFTTTGTFMLYLAPLDGFNNAVSGPGTPGLSLESVDSSLTVTRTQNPNTTGPNVGKIAYSVTFSGINFAAPVPMALNVYGFTADPKAPIGRIDVTVSGA